MDFPIDEENEVNLEIDSENVIFYKKYFKQIFSFSNVSIVFIKQKINLNLENITQWCI